MAVKVGINGFGRIGRNVFRAALGNPAIEFVAVNDLTSPATLAHLLKYDSILGNLSHTITAGDDFIAVDGSPLENITILQDKTRIRHVHIGGKRMQIPERSYDPRQVTDRSMVNWSDLYTQERVRELYPARQRLAAAE